MLLITLQGVRELALEDQIPHAIKAQIVFKPFALPKHNMLLFLSFLVKVSYGTIHATFVNYKDIRSQVYANRGGAREFVSMLLKDF